MIPARASPGRAALAILLGLSAVIAPRARADNCTLNRLADLPVIDDRLESATISALLNGRPRKLEIDTGGFGNMLDPSVAADYSVRSVGVRDYLGLDRIVLDRMVRVPSVQIGSMAPADLDFFVAPAGYLSVDGTLGDRWLQKWDLEVDPVNARVSLFSQDHCGGQGVYWPHQDLATIPLRADRFGNLSVTLMLDGKQIRTVVDTGSADTILSLDAAARLFGLRPGSPGVQNIGSILGKDGKPHRLYRYQFKSLDLGGITLANPWLTLAPMARGDASGVYPGRLNSRLTDRPFGETEPDLVLGMHHLRGLHLYFAYGEGKLYATTVRGDIEQQTGKAGEASRRPDPMTLTDIEDSLLTAAVDLREKDYDGALAAADKVLQLDPGSSDGYAMRSKLHELQGRRELASRDLDESLRHNPGNAIVYAERAGFYWRGGDKVRAIADINRAIGADSSSSGAYLLRATFESAMGQTDRALADADHAISLDRRNANAYSGRATIYAAAGKYDLAFNDEDVAVHLQPRSAGALNNRCWFGAILGRLDQALDDCDASLDIDPSSAEALDSRAFVEMKRGRLDRAVIDYTAALAVDPKLASSLYGRGLTKRQQGDVAGGVADMAAARAIDPDIAEHFGK